MEGLILKRRVRQGVAELNIGNRLAFDDHVGLTNRIRLRVDLLAKQVDLGVLVEIFDLIISRREHSARARRGVIHRANHSWSGQVGIPV